MLTLASWNMNRTASSWSYLPELRAKHEVDVFLLQEAGRPALPPAGFVVEPGPEERERWRILPKRYYCSAIASPSDGPAVTPRRPVPLRDAKADWGEFVASHPGQFAVADIATAGGDVVTVVSLYGIWDKIPETGRLFADGSLHRAISDLTVVFERGRGQNVVVAGDLNVWHAYEGTDETKRFAALFDRLDSLGLELLGPFRPDGTPQLAGCPCRSVSCRHVNTYRHGRKADAVPYQNDYVFATASMASRLAPGGCFAADDAAVWEHSDHLPLVARFELDA